MSSVLSLMGKNTSSIFKDAYLQAQFESKFYSSIHLHVQVCTFVLLYICLENAFKNI